MRSYAASAALGLALALPSTAVTVYSQVPMKAASTSAPIAASGTTGDTSYTGSAAYNPLVLAVPPVPSNLAQFIGYTLPAQVPAGASIKQRGDFYGLSIEMSVSNQTLGKNSTNINVPFLNLMANLAQRGGNVNVRVGGNTQEQAELVDFLPNGIILSKDYAHTSGRTGTPPITYTADLLYMMANVSTLVDVNWWLGVPFFTPSPLNMDIMVVGDNILGQRLLGFQVGNEPDLYVAHGHRPNTYQPADYGGEFGDAVRAIAANSSITVKNNLMAPSVASGQGNWQPEDVWNTGFLDTYADNLKYITVEHYPTDNCAAQFGGPNPKNPQDQLGVYLNHQAGQLIVQPYLNSTALAQAHNKPMIMFETNTASCGGFAGISNSYVSALWALDYGLQMAYSNFSGANLHVGGQSTFYNPFTPPPTNQSHFHQWTIGPIYYSMLVVAEALGQTGTAQVIDLYPQSEAQPNYAIYENGKPSKLVLFNYASDPSGASNYQFNATIDGGSVPSQVAVKYLLAPTVTSKDNITWAGQTFGGDFASDGRLQGTLNVTTVPCDTATNTCLVTVPAPGVALVFFNTNDAEINDGAATQGASTFATTTLHSKTKSGANTATMDPAVLATSNGSSAKDRKANGGTSKASSKSGARAQVAPVAGVILAVAAGAWATFLG